MNIFLFPLIFQFSHNVLRSYEALINSTCNSGWHRIFKHSLIFFFSSLQLITDLIENLEAQLFSFFPAYNLSLIFCQLSEYLYFYKMKTCKISCRKVKISISPRDGNFQFSARVERCVFSKKIHPGVNFTSPMCNMPLRFGLEKCLDYLT